MVKDHSDSERGNLLLPIHGLLFFTISSKSYYIYIYIYIYKTSHKQDNANHRFLFYTSRGSLAGNLYRCLVDHDV